MTESGTAQKVREYIRKTGMLKRRDRVTAGVSGGADSVFLFYVLKELAGELQLDFRVLHVHHGIRGREADRDAEFVRELCRTEGIPCRIVYRNVPEEARGSGMTLEEAGRAARYGVFREEITAGRLVAVAHHRDDNAETLLFRLARGTGIHGMAGMRPMRDGIIRPLLAVTRAEIERELTARGIRWTEDSTNAENEAARNRIRHEIMPEIERLVNARAAEHFAASAERAAEVSDFIRSEGLKRAGKYVRTPEPGELIMDSALLREMPAMRDEVIRQALVRAAGSEKDIGEIHVRIVRDLLEGRDGRRADLPYGLAAVKDTAAGGVRLVKQAAPGDRSGGSSARASAGSGSGACPRADAGAAETFPLAEETGSVRVPGRGTFFWRVSGSFPEMAADAGGSVVLPEKRYTKWFDYDKMTNTPCIRNRLNGDFLSTGRAGSHKKLSDYLTDEKVPVSERDRLLLLADGPEIVWAVGMRIGWKYRVSAETKCVLEVEFTPEHPESPRKETG